MDALPADLNARLMAMLEESERLEAAQREGEPVAGGLLELAEAFARWEDEAKVRGVDTGPGWTAGQRAYLWRIRAMAERGLRAEKQAQRAGPGIGPT